MCEAERLIRRLGATAKCLGFHYLIAAVEMVMQDNDCILALTKCIYPQIAERFDTTAVAIERNLRTVIDVCWRYGDRRLLFEVTGRSLEEKPSCAEFIDMLAAYINSQQQYARPATEKTCVFCTKFASLTEA